MMKYAAIVLVIVFLGLLAWVLFQSSDSTVIVNGHKLVGPAKVAAEVWGVLVAIVRIGRVQSRRARNASPSDIAPVRANASAWRLSGTVPSLTACASI